MEVGDVSARKHLLACAFCATTRSTASLASKTTNPKPRGFPVAKSVLIVTSLTVPKVLKYSVRSSFLNSHARPNVMTLMEGDRLEEEKRDTG